MRIFLFQALIIYSLFFFFRSLVITHRAGTLFPQVGEIVVAGVPVGPGDVDTASRRYVHLYAGGLPSFIERYRHWMAIFDDQDSGLCSARLQAGIVNLTQLPT